jgi:hypothetical protein
MGQTVLEAFDAYGPTIIVWLSLGLLLGLRSWGWWESCAQLVFVLSWSYFGHRAAHLISSEYPFSVINPHVSIHHNSGTWLPRWANLALETLVNLSGFLCLLLAQWLLGVNVLSQSIVIYAALLYVTLHIADYSIIGSPYHIQHHKQTYCNYSPEVFDTIFGTRCDPSNPFTKNSNEMIHGFIAFLGAGALQWWFELN